MPAKPDPRTPMHRIAFTKLSEARISAALKDVAKVGPACVSPLSDSLAGKSLTVVTDKGPTLAYRFAGANRLSVAENGGRAVEAGYGALVQDHITLIAHLVPGTMRGYAVVIDGRSSIATVDPAGPPPTTTIGGVIALHSRRDPVPVPVRSNALPRVRRSGRRSPPDSTPNERRLPSESGSVPVRESDAGRGPHPRCPLLAPVDAFVRLDGYLEEAGPWSARTSRSTSFSWERVRRRWRPASI